MKKKLLTAFAVSASMVGSAYCAETTEITISDKIVQKDISALGINISGDSYYSAPKMKVRYAENFEGTIYRQCHRGTLFEDGFASEYVSEKAVTKYWGPEKGNYSYLYPGAKVTIISGPAYGEVRTIKEVKFRMANHAWKYKMKREGKKKTKINIQESQAFFVFDKKISLPNGPMQKAGILIYSDKSSEGCMSQRFSAKNTYWGSTNTSFSNDVMPNEFGKSSLSLNADKSQTIWDAEKEAVIENGVKEAYFAGATSFRKYYNTNGKWHIKIKAKLLDDNAEFIIRTRNIINKQEQKISVTKEWKQFDIVFDISGIKAINKDDTGETFLIFEAVAKNGKVLIDDFLIYKETDDKNPTVFMDSFVNTLKNLNPGILRHLMMGGDMLSTLSTKIKSTRSTNIITSAAGPKKSKKQQPFGMGEFYELCEYLNAEAWFCLPGTLDLEEVDLYMEYIGGPAGTKGGDLRISQGYEKPWIDSLKKIHIEPGNECWNTIKGYLANSYNGPDYWENIFKRIKSSPYYKNNIICHASGQNYGTNMSDRILNDTPSADKYAIAPYQIHGFSKVDLDKFKTKEEFFKYCITYPTQTVITKMKAQDEIAKKYGKELSVYEVNWHMTGKDVDPKGKKKEAKAIRNRINEFVASTAGGLGHLNHLLMLVENFGMRSMCHFTLAGDYFGIKLWGIVLGMGENLERYRPAGLVFSVINEMMRGDLITTAHSANQPMFSSVGNFASTKKGKKLKKGEASPVSEVTNPLIWSYAFKDGKKYSLVLMNMDLENTQDIKLNFKGSVIKSSVKSKIVAPDNFIDNNEFESGEAKVKIKDVNIANFANGKIITLKPSSCQTITWILE